MTRRNKLNKYKRKNKTQKYRKKNKQFGGAYRGEEEENQEMYSRYRSLFDTIHDFKTLMSDVVHYSRNEDSESLHRLIFTIMLRNCFQSYGTVPDLKYISNRCGQLCSRMLKVPSCNPDLENNFLNGNYNENIIDFSLNKLDDIYSSLNTGGWMGAEGKVNLIVDTQKQFFKYLLDEPGKPGDKWRYILTRESVFDPAGKLNYRTHGDAIGKRFGNEYYYETTQNIRTYNPSQVEGRYNIQLTPIFFNKSIDSSRPYIGYRLENNVSGSDESTKTIRAILNSTVKHPNSISNVKKTILKAQKDLVGMSLFSNRLRNTARDYYTDIYIKNDNLDLRPELINTYTSALSSKRYSDELMAEVCRYILSGKGGVEVTNSSGNKELTLNQENPLVLLTIDRMLFVAACENYKNIACILDTGKNYLVHIPPIKYSIENANRAYNTMNGGYKEATQEEKNDVKYEQLHQPPVTNRSIINQEFNERINSDPIKIFKIIIHYFIFISSKKGKEVRNLTNINVFNQFRTTNECLYYKIKENIITTYKYNNGICCALSTGVSIDENIDENINYLPEEFNDLSDEYPEIYILLTERAIYNYFGSLLLSKLIQNESIDSLIGDIKEERLRCILKLDKNVVLTISFKENENDESKNEITITKYTLETMEQITILTRNIVELEIQAEQEVEDGALRKRVESLFYHFARTLVTGTISVTGTVVRNSVAVVGWLLSPAEDATVSEFITLTMKAMNQNEVDHIEFSKSEFNKSPFSDKIDNKIIDKRKREILYKIYKTIENMCRAFDKIVDEEQFKSVKEEMKKGNGDLIYRIGPETYNKIKNYCLKHHKKQSGPKKGGSNIKIHTQPDIMIKLLHILRKYEMLVLLDDEESAMYYYDDGKSCYYKFVKDWELHHFIFMLLHEDINTIKEILYHLAKTKTEPIYKEIYLGILHIIIYVDPNYDITQFFSESEEPPSNTHEDFFAEFIGDIEYIDLTAFLTQIDNFNVVTKKEQIKIIQKYIYNMKDYQIYSSYGFSEMYDLRNSITQQNVNVEETKVVPTKVDEKNVHANNVDGNTLNPYKNKNSNHLFKLERLAEKPTRFTDSRARTLIGAGGGRKRNTKKRKKKLRKTKRNTKKTTRK